MSQDSAAGDLDPVETREWLESIDSVLSAAGPERAVAGIAGERVKIMEEEKDLLEAMKTAIVSLNTCSGKNDFRGFISSPGAGATPCRRTR